MGYEDENQIRLKAFKGWMVNDELMALANSGALFMHCLPAHRGEEVEANVIDGPRSIIWRQAYHRRTTIQSILYHLVRGDLKGYTH
jgi:ornithine carbamoyltransferase